MQPLACRLGPTPIPPDRRGAREAFYDVRDITGTLNALRAAGAVVGQEPTDVGAGLLVARARDTEGNIVGAKQLPAS